jgi:hypothetical protein
MLILSFSLRCHAADAADYVFAAAGFSAIFDTPPLFSAISCRRHFAIFFFTPCRFSSRHFRHYIAISAISGLLRWLLRDTIAPALLMFRHFELSAFAAPAFATDRFRQPPPFRHFDYFRLLRFITLISLR